MIRRFTFAVCVACILAATAAARVSSGGVEIVAVPDRLAVFNVIVEWDPYGGLDEKGNPNFLCATALEMGISECVEQKTEQQAVNQLLVTVQAALDQAGESWAELFTYPTMRPWPSYLLSGRTYALKLKGESINKVSTSRRSGAPARR